MNVNICFCFYCRILSKSTSLIDTWTYIHGNKSPGFTFSTLNDDLNKRVGIMIFLKPVAK